jgi:hypothetical protein
MPVQEAPLMTQHPSIPGLMVKATDVIPTGHNPLPVALPTNCVTIASVVPWDLVSQPYHQLVGRPVFKLEAPKEKGGYSLCRCYNTISWLRMPSNGTQQPLVDVPVPRLAVDPANPASGYANNLIEEFAGGRPGFENGRLGVGIIIGKKPWQADNEPTAEEVAQLHKIQRAFFLGLVNKADVAHNSGDEKLKRSVGWNESSTALRWANILYGEGVENHAWYQGRSGDAILVPCPVCRTFISSDAFKCSQCREDLAEYFMERGGDVTKYAGVAKEIEYRRAKQAKGKKEQ